MADYSRGVSGYVKGQAIIEVNFPIDLKGNGDVCCTQCPYYSRYDRKCNLNGKLVNFPEKYIGTGCPLVFEDEIEEEYEDV